MPCDTKMSFKGQTVSQRADEIRAMVAKLSAGIASGRVKVRIGPQGGIAFSGLTEAERDGVTDSCAYRRILATGSATAKAAIARAEQLAGRTVDRRAVAQGLHAHGDVWHDHK